MSATVVEHWAFLQAWLTPNGLDRLNDDYEHRDLYAPNRPGGASSISRPDFAAGWIAMAARRKDWLYFTTTGHQMFGP